MSSTKAIKQRIRSVKNTSQITKAMEVVSATKMRKSQMFALNARPYAATSLEMLKNLLSHTTTPHPLLQSREINPVRSSRASGPGGTRDFVASATSNGVKKSALLIITSDKGLAGAFNSNVLKKAEAWIAKKQLVRLNLTSDLTGEFMIITIGKKARDYFGRRNVPIYKSFVGFGDYSTLQETMPVAEEILQGFLNGTFDEVGAVYTNFRTTLMQEAVLKKILPATQEGVEEIIKGILPERGKYAKNTEYLIPNTKYSYEYKFEPSATEILNDLVPQLIRMHIHHIILESNASEHSARMVAMKSASDNARDLIGDLTLEYNKSRQANITRELTEITAGKEALES